MRLTCDVHWHYHVEVGVRIASQECKRGLHNVAERPHRIPALAQLRPSGTLQAPARHCEKPLGVVTKGTFQLRGPCQTFPWSDTHLGTTTENSYRTGDSRAPGHRARQAPRQPSSPSSVLYLQARRGSSVVEQGTHKPLVGSSNLPLATCRRGPLPDGGPLCFNPGCGYLAR